MSTKLYIGNVPLSMTREDILHMFEPYGEIVECDIVKNYAFLHYSKAESARDAAARLNDVKFDNTALKVEVSRSKLHTEPGTSDRSQSSGTTKVFIGNVPSSANSDALRKLFETYGKVVSCDIVRDFAFVHFEHESEAELAVEMLNGADFEGNTLSVEKSFKKRRDPGPPGAQQVCFRCGRPGHMVRDCYYPPMSTGYGEPNGYRSHAPPMGRAPPLPPNPYDPYDDVYDDPYYRYAVYRSRYPERYPPRDPLPPLPDRYRDYVDPYDRQPSRYSSSARIAYRDPFERPPPYYYERSASRRESARDPYEDRDRYAMRARDSVPRRRAPPY